MNTKTAITRQFMNEYMNRDFSLITIKGLCAATLVARTTFYSYFNNTDEVREFVEDDLISGLIAVTDRVSNPMIEQGHGKILNISSVAAFCAGPYMSIYYATKEFVRSFSEAVEEEVKGTGITVTAFCPGPTATGFEQAAAMEKGSTMFRKAAKAEDVALGGIRAMKRGKALNYYGVYTKSMGFLCRLVPRSVARKYAAKINQ